MNNEEFTSVIIIKNIYFLNIYHKIGVFKHNFFFHLKYNFFTHVSMVRWHEGVKEYMIRGTKMTVETKISQFKSLKPKSHSSFQRFVNQFSPIRLSFFSKS
jgi:hypothetical protein